MGLSSELETFLNVAKNPIQTAIHSLPNFGCENYLGITLKAISAQYEIP